PHGGALRGRGAPPRTRRGRRRRRQSAGSRRRSSRPRRVASARSAHPQRRGRAGTAAGLVRPLRRGTGTNGWRGSGIPLPCAAGGAGGRPAAPPPRELPRTVAVLPPHNQTGGRLPVAGSSLLERYAFDTRPVTVPEVLSSEARLQLASGGFAVVPADVVARAT